MKDTFTLSAMLFAGFSIVMMTDRPAQAACASLVASMCPRDAPVTMTARFIRMPPRPPAFAVGETFPVAQHSLLMNPAHYGLPPVTGDWRYYRVKGEVFRVDATTAEVLEVVKGGNRRQLR
jgi:hypothetical protein